MQFDASGRPPLKPSYDRDWHQLPRWRRRAKHQLKIEPLCRMCAVKGIHTPANVVDHVEPFKGDWNAFWLSPLQSLCKDCHDSRKRYVEALGYDPKLAGEDGWPLDHRHPANRRTQLLNRPRSAPLARVGQANPKS